MVESINTIAISVSDFGRHGLGWLRNNPLARIEEVKG